MTERIKIYKNGQGMNEALDFTEKFSDAIKLERREKFRLRLLAEEMFCMVKTITGEFSADFWIEADNKNCRLHLEAKSNLDYSKRREFLSVSTQGKNIASRGIMNKIREFVEAGLYSIQEGLALQNENGVGMFSYGAMGIDSCMNEAIFSWSMQKYKNDIEAARSENPDAWDELEKSIIANVADEVQVGISKNQVDLIVQKNFN